MHNVVVPLRDNPTAIRDSPRDLLIGEKPVCLCATASNAEPEQMLLTHKGCYQNTHRPQLEDDLEQLKLGVFIQVVCFYSNLQISEQNFENTAVVEVFLL